MLDRPTRRLGGLAFTMLLVALAATAAPAHAAFPGRNGPIAFAQAAGSGFYPPTFEQSRLATARPGQGTARILLECQHAGGVPRGGDCTGTSYRSPAYSPDGRALVFDAGERLAVMDASGGPVRLLPATTADDGEPAFSPDGRLIVFSGANDRGTTDLYVRRLDGGDALVVVSDAGEPAWSSKGRLAYVRNGNVYTADPSGRRRRFVTSGISPDWSPHGTRLALVRPSPRLVMDAPHGRIYTVGARGRGLRRIGRARLASNPVWSPDGRWIAYDGFDLGVFTKRLGSRRPARQVAPTAYGGSSFIDSFHPTWRPLPRR